MTAPKDDSSKTFETQNTIVAGVTVGAMLGFALAIWFGAITTGEGSKFTDWIQSTAAVSASIISAVAVVLVAKTLKATRDTLDATRIMAEDQKRIGDAQTRAWVMVSDISVDNGVYSASQSDIFHNVTVTLKNYGNTPAEWIRFDYEFKHVPYPLPDLKFKPFGSDSLAYGLAPGQTVLSGMGGLLIHTAKNFVTVVYVDWEYCLLDGRTIADRNTYIACVRNGVTTFRPVAKGDYASNI